MATQGRRVKVLSREPQTDHLLRQAVERRIPETVGRNGLQMVVHTLRIVDGAVGESGQG